MFNFEYQVNWYATGRKSSNPLNFFCKTIEEVGAFIERAENMYLNIEYTIYRRQVTDWEVIDL